MAEKDKFVESTINQKYPAKDQIIARLVQIREYTEKAEETLNNMPPNSQNDPKFYQLQEMIAEMRDTEKKLVDTLHDYDSELPCRNRLNVENSQGSTHTVHGSNFTEGDDDFSLLGAHFANVDPELLAEREKLKKRCLDSQNKIEDLEKQRKYLLAACGRASENEKSSPNQGIIPENLDINKRLQMVREGDSIIFSRRCQSTEGLVSSEDIRESETAGQTLSELTDKRVEIHNIISEIALLRRAKDESARKIELLQHALKNSEVGENGLNLDSPLGATSDKNESTEFQEVLENEKDPFDGENGGFHGPIDWMSDSFSQTITRKLVEIQTMREKLEALQSLVHTIPTSSNFQGDAMVDFNSNPNDICKEAGLFDLAEKFRELSRWTGEVFRPGLNASANIRKNSQLHSQLPMNIPVKSDNVRLSTSDAVCEDRFNIEEQSMEFNNDDVKSRYSIGGGNYASDLEVRRANRNHFTNRKSQSRDIGMDDYEGPPMTHPCASGHRIDSSGRSFSVYNPREVKPVPLRPQPAAFSDTMIFPGPPRNGREDVFIQRNYSGSNERFPELFNCQRNREILSGNDRIVGNPMADTGRHWLSGTVHGNSGFRRTNSQSQLTNLNVYSNADVDSNSMLRHLVHSVGVIAAGMANQKKQLDNIKDSVERLADRVDLLLPEVPRMMGDDGSVGRRNNTRGVFTAGNKPATGMMPNVNSIPASGNVIDESTFYQGSRSHPNVYQGMSVGISGSRDNKGRNPVREIWGSTTTTPHQVNYPQEHSNLPAFSEDNSPGPSVSAFYNPNPSNSAKIKRPWISPSVPLESNRLMLNNQVPPGNRTNNYWDNFRSQSRQNVLSSSSKNESFNAVVAVNPEVAHNQAAGGSNTNNFNRTEIRQDKNPGAKPIKAVMMKHFVENIGSKKRNQEQQRQMLPQRSVSVGSMPHTGESSNQPTAGPSRVNLRNGTNDAGGDTACFGMNKRYPNYPGDRFSNKLTAKEANVLRQAQLGQDCLKEVCSKVTQLKNEHIRHRTIDALRNFVAQSILQDEIECSQQIDSSQVMQGIMEGNLILHECEPVQTTAVTQTSTPSSRSGDLNEVLWMESSEPFLTNASRVLSFPGATDRSEPGSHSTTATRRTDLSSISDELYRDTHLFLPGEPRLTTEGRSGSNEVVATISSVSRQRSKEPWPNSVDIPFLSNDPRMAPYMELDRKNPPVGNTQESHQDVMNDLCMDNGDGSFATTNLRLPSYLRATNRCTVSSPEVVARFSESQNSASDSKKRVGEELADRDNSHSSEHCDGKQENLVDLKHPISSMTPIRDLTADLDVNLLNISGSTFLTEPASPDVLPVCSSSPSSEFSSNVIYKGRSMSSTNNPWVGNSGQEDRSDMSHTVEVNKDEQKANEEVAELTEERRRAQDSPFFEKKDTNL